ncbi:hypothetical protein GCM10023322_43400 [Rugosimonospora acidiphila]|uniref:Dienelactone hydrolase domain-containing protein n=1 Tax=Rugosimonospora acidiphila TaxID=556531 RepID=A0ABP9S0I0_9ACTN
MWAGTAHTVAATSLLRDQCTDTLPDALAAVGTPGPSPGRVTLAGLGAGGRIALDAALTGEVAAAGAIAFAPDLGPLATRLAAGPVPANPTPPRCVVFTGDRPGALDSCRRFEDWAARAAVPCRLVVEPGLGHAYPEDSAAARREAPAWIRP